MTHHITPSKNVAEVFWTFLRLGLTSFGGPVAHLGYFREELVSRRKWVTENQYAELVALCQFLPGPASSQVGFALGMIRGGWLGAISAWFTFTLPSAILLVLFAAVSVNLLETELGAGVITGLKAVTVAVVAHAVLGMARTLTPDVPRVLLALVALVIAVLWPGTWGQVIAILMGLGFGLMIFRRQSPAQEAVLDVRVSKFAGMTATVLVGALLIALPVLTRWTQNLGIAVVDGFYRAGALVFGGGHVMLPLLESETVVASNVGTDQFMAGYGVAQAVPGPLFTFAAFLGFEISPGTEGLVLSLLALIAVFVPGLLLVIGILPFWNILREKPLIRAALSGANAAVVGILAAALANPVATTGVTGWLTLIIALGGFALLQWAKQPAWLVVILGVVAGIVVSTTGWDLSWSSS